ncbi:MAG: hypothetical protein LBL58_09535 [Tannerellaceae bacterium]|jgi:hypothetical protein|nr:hypothetical protein [Tannerellaceae bacterium]
MSKPIVFIFISIIVLSGCFSACNDLNDDYSTNPNLRLSFSVDTLTFDTVFTTIGSATLQFMVYNTNKEPLNIESIRLVNTEKSNFRMNVDGRSGETFSGIRILSKDSMYVFVEVTVDPTGSDEPLLIEDHIEFTTNGVKQTILLQAYGQDANLIKGGFIFDKDTILSAERPYLVYDSITIAEGVTVSIEKGTSFYMHDKAKWIIYGTVNATGTLEEPITFRGDRLDNLLTDLPYDRISGLWDGFYFKPESFDNVMDYTVVRNSTGGVVCEESTPERLKLTVTNTQITNSSGNIFRAVNCHIEASNTEFSNAKKGLVSLQGGEYHFIHCTLVNQYKISPRNVQPVLTLANYYMTVSNEEATIKNVALKKAVFDNCIIDGSYPEGAEELKGEILIDKKEDEFNFLFNHCAVKTKKTTNASFTGTQFITNDYFPHYKSIGNDDNHYVNDFRPEINKDKEGNPEKEQPVIGRADRSIAEKYPFDRFGVDRLTSEDGPDIGACEYVAEPEKEE